MTKLLRILGKRGRITIPYEIRQRAGFAYNDVLSFTESSDGRTVIIRREKICDNCKGAQPTEKDSDTVTLLEFLDGLSVNEQRAALIHLSVKWAEHQTINAGNHASGKKQCKMRELVAAESLCGSSACQGGDLNA